MIGTLGQFVREIRDLLSGTGDPIPVSVEGASLELTAEGVTIDNAAEEPIPVYPTSVISTGNGTTSNLNAAAVFTGAGAEVSPRYGTVSVCIFASHNSAANGLKFQASIDNINWETIDEYAYAASQGLQSYNFAPSGRYFRLTYTNGGTATTKLIIFTVFRSGYTKSSSHRISDTITGEKNAELVKAVLAAEKPNATLSTSIQLPVAT